MKKCPQQNGSRKRQEITLSLSDADYTRFERICKAKGIKAEEFALEAVVWFLERLEKSSSSPDLE